MTGLVLYFGSHELLWFQQTPIALSQNCKLATEVLLLNFKSAFHFRTKAYFSHHGASVE